MLRQCCSSILGCCSFLGLYPSCPGAANWPQHMVPCHNFAARLHEFAARLCCKMRGTYKSWTLLDTAASIFATWSTGRNWREAAASGTLNPDWQQFASLCQNGIVHFKDSFRWHWSTEGPNGLSTNQFPGSYHPATLKIWELNLKFSLCLQAKPSERPLA